MELVNEMKHSLVWTTTLTTFAVMILSFSCASPEQPVSETAASRGQRDRVMSELHATRKQLLDALDTISEEKFKTKMGENQPSPSEAVEALIIRERKLLTAMSSAELDPTVKPANEEAMSREERQRVAQENAQAMQTFIQGCAEKMGPEEFRVVPNPANLGQADLAQGFKVARDDMIAFARGRNTESNPYK